jgi:uncharacterized protein with NAD-binding domain and iron-sulfur cluster
VTPKRVVIVGGGCAGLSAAWQLAKLPGYEIHVYEKAARLGGKGASVRAKDGRILDHGLHVWMGWYENAFRMMRECYAIVEEKRWGPSSSTRRLAHGRFDDAFMPEPNVGLVDPNFEDGAPAIWSVYFPPNEGLPGTPMTDGDNPFTLASYLIRLVEMVRALILSEVGGMPGDTPGPARPEHRSRSDEILNLDIKTAPADSTAALLNRMGELSKAGVLTGAAALLQLVTILEVWLRQQNIGPKAPESTLAIAEAAVSQVRKLLRDLVSVDPRLRVKTEVIDIVLTIIIGLFTDRVIFRTDGLDSLNDFDYREWLRLHGATVTSLKSRFIRAAYDFAFAYEDGDLKKPSLAAGVAVRGGLRMFFTYRGAAFWRMRSGMGDAIFAPLYAVLDDWREAQASAVAKPPNRQLLGYVFEAWGGSHGKGPNSQLLGYLFNEWGGMWEQPDTAPSGNRKAGGELLRSPVTFHFCNTLESAQFDDDGRSLKALTFGRTTPPMNVLQNGGWSAPAARAKVLAPQPNRTLTRRNNPNVRLGADEFDFAIIATGIREFADVFVRPHDKKPKGSPGRPIAHKAWALTTSLTKTVATKSAQVWMSKDLYELGWRHGSGLFTCLGRETFDSYADMTHLIPTEDSAATRAVRDGALAVAPKKWSSIAYFCSPLDERLRLPSAKQDLKQATARGHANPIPKNVEKLITEDLEALTTKDLEKLITEHMDSFWPDLFDTEMDAPARRAAWQGWLNGKDATYYVRANWRDSDRYTLSLPRSIASRISPLDPGVDNMTVAGDWTACGLDCGCVEAAVMSGMLAAVAIDGRPEDLDKIVGYDQP